MNPRLSFRCPLNALPRPVVAGCFPLADRAFATPYRIRAHALHLYDYPASMRLGGEQWELRPGDLTLTPGGMESRYDLPRPGRHWCVHFLTAQATGACLELPLHLRLGPAAVAAQERLARIVQHHRLAHGLGTASPAEVAAAAGLLELLCWLATLAEDPAGVARGERGVIRAAELLRTSPERAWRSDALARVVGLSPGWLARRFRLRFGCTLARYQQRQRIGAAQALLACTALPVAEVGARVGIPDPHHFNKLFRRVAGQAPSAFRESLQPG